MTVDIWTGRDYFVDTYRNRAYPIFRPITVAGLPAAEQQTPEGPSSCVITVGVAPRKALETFIYVDEVRGGLPAVDPCAEGRRVIAAIVATLPPL